MKHTLDRRIRNVEGQLAGIRKMMENESTCTDVLVQMKAARAGFDRVYSIFLEENLLKCNAIAKLPEDKRAEVSKLIQELVKAY